MSVLQYAPIAYIEPDARFNKEKPYASVVPFLSEGASYTNTTLTTHHMPISSVRGREHEFNLDVNGFQYVKYASTIRPTTHITRPDHPYVVEMSNMLKSLLGAKSVDAYDCNV
jgi:hypothetical protein